MPEQKDISNQWLVDTNALVMRNLGTPTGFRTRAVIAIGHQKVSLPMPDEILALMNEYEEWLACALAQVRQTHLSHEPLQNSAR